MTVNPGFGGQTFIGYCKDKIKILRKRIDEKKLSTLIEIDGGVKISNMKELKICGADVFVAGSAIFQSEDYSLTLSQMKKEIS